ncbi:hypothetical protein [Nitrosomonas sp.]|uniref:hypothetical protein n=1 Tax=Nitrosomonas sp. TaxID=42353 RepID=UPI0025D3772D|nr:hypothetical protein [Nitrosomonas sp.]MBV6447090.1 hypothetical protein [Nitrosomonas sp.]
MNTEPRTKISILREHMAAGRWQKAISIAAKFPRLGQHKDIILRAHGAYTNPHFYTQIGKDIEALKVAGHAALLEKYSR